MHPASHSVEDPGMSWAKLAKEVLEKHNGIAHANYAAALRQCGNLKALADGKCVHARMADSGHCEDTFLSNLLIQMYGKCKSVDDARLVFNKMPQRNGFSWSLMIAAYAQNGHHRCAWQLFQQMDCEGEEPDEGVYVSVLGVCSKLRNLAEGREIHSCIASKGLESDVLVGTALLDMYSKCGSLENARCVFDRMSQRDVVSWTAMIVAYAQQGHGRKALDLFHRMDLEGVELDKVALGAALAACGILEDLAAGKAVHARAIACGLDSDVVLATGLFNMYAKCGSLDDARNVFSRMRRRDLVSWNAMIAAYAQSGHNMEALALYKEMSSSGPAPDSFTYVSVVGACSALQALDEAKPIHARIIADGFESDNAVATALVDAYAKCGSLDDARNMFYKMPQRQLVSWNAMVAAYTQHGHGEAAVRLFQTMDLEGLKPNDITFLCTLSACTSLGALAQGKELHARMVASGINLDAASSRSIDGVGFEASVVGTALVNMYAKCGRLDDAGQVFFKMHWRDTVAWNAMIAANAHHGNGEEALQLFQQMNLEGAVPNEATFTGILHACSHAGLLSEGRDYYSCMTEDHGVVATADHAACMIDSLGRAGRLGEAEEIVKNMAYQPDSVAWTALLGASKIHGNLEHAAHAAEQVAEVEPKEAAAYVLVSNMYASTSKKACRINLQNDRNAN